MCLSRIASLLGYPDKLRLRDSSTKQFQYATLLKLSLTNSTCVSYSQRVSLKSQPSIGGRLCGIALKVIVSMYRVNLPAGKEVRHQIAKRVGAKLSRRVFRNLEL